MTAPNLRQTQGSTPNNSPPSGPVSTSTCHAGRTPLSDREVAQSRSANSRSLYPHLQDSTSPAPPRRLSGQGRRCGDRDGIGSDLFPVAHYRRRRGSSRWRRMGQQPDRNRRGGGGHLARMGAAKPAGCYSARRFDADRRANPLISIDSGGQISAPNNTRRFIEAYSFKPAVCLRRSCFSTFDPNARSAGLNRQLRKAVSMGRSRTPSRSGSDQLRLKIGRCRVIGKVTSCQGRRTAILRPWSNVIQVT